MGVLIIDLNWDGTVEHTAAFFEEKGPQKMAKWTVLRLQKHVYWKVKAQVAIT